METSNNLGGEDLRRFQIALATFILLLLFSPLTWAKTTVTVTDESPALLDLSSGQMMITARELFRLAGDKPEWEIGSNEIIVKIDDQTYRLDLQQGTINGVKLQPAPQVREGRTYLPVRQAAGILGLQVNWQEDKLYLNRPGEAPQAISYLRLLGTYTIVFSPKEAATANFRNARHAGQYLEGVVIKPGEEFSFNGVVGPRTAARGYITGIVFAGLRKIREVGGGVCRTATLVHNAVLAAGLEVIERQRHSQKVTYVPAGRDATVYYGVLDYRFRNNHRNRFCCTLPVPRIA